MVYDSKKKKTLAKMNTNYSNVCWKCKNKEVSQYHLWWSCTRAKEFWNIIHRKIQRILKSRIPKRLEFLLLGIDLQKIQKKKKDRTLVWYMIVAARFTYAKYNSKYLK